MLATTLMFHDLLRRARRNNRWAEYAPAVLVELRGFEPRRLAAKMPSELR
jgi:hypothetical protein